jgi:anti-sigma B factor antagonist
MADDKLTIDVSDGPRPDEKIVHLEGVLNAETAFRFRDAVRPYEPATLILDMTHVRSMDSSGIGVLIGLFASYERNYRRLLLAGINDRIWDVFRVCKIDGVFTRYHTVAEAAAVV